MTERLAASVDGPQRVCRITTGQTIARLIVSESGLVLVSDSGFISGEIGRTVINPDPVAWEHGWFAEDRSGLKLLDEFENWARGKGATLIKMSCNGGPAQKILARRGYRPAEIQMVK